MFNRSLKWLESNVASIVLALLLALAIWIIATQQENPVEEASYDSEIPIDYVGLSDGLIITNEPPQTATVSLRVQQRTLADLSLDDFRITVDLNGLGAGEFVALPLVAAVKAQAIIVGTDPATVNVNIEEIRERELPIQLDTTGSLPNGFNMGPIELDPRSVVVRGPRSEVELISEIRAEADIDGLRDSFSDTLHLTALDSDGNAIQNVTISPPEVVANIPVVQEDDFREVAVRVDGNFQPAPGYYVSRFTTDPLLVPVRGEVEVIKNLRFIETEPIRLTNLTEDTTLTVQLEPPDGVSLEGMQTVEVIINVEAQPGFRVLEIPVTVSGLTEGLEATVTPDTVGVFLSGPQPILDRIGTDVEVIVTVDATDLAADTYQLEPTTDIVSGDVANEELNNVVIESVVPTLIDVEIVSGVDNSR
jgi:YbbR domain-containing protein